MNLWPFNCLYPLRDPDRPIKKHREEDKKRAKERSERLSGIIKEVTDDAVNNHPGVKLLSILSEANIDLQKKVFKVMKQYLHPDKDTGNEALFKRLKDIEAYFNEQRH